MKRVFICFMIISSLCFGSWEYDKQFRYDLESNMELVANLNTSFDQYLSFYKFEDSPIFIGLSGYFEPGSEFIVKIYVDEKKIDEIKMQAFTNMSIEGMVSKKVIEAFKKGNKCVIAFLTNFGAVQSEFDLNGFTKTYNKIKQPKYHSNSF